MSALYGLVLAGGRSSRMGRDKGLLDYRGVPHRVWVRDALAAHCAQVFVSLSAAQAAAAPDLVSIVDDPRYDCTPIGALLTAHAVHPGNSWFVVSCDLPFFDAACAQRLIDAREPARAGTAFLIAELNQPEPLVTIYEAAFVAALPQIYAAGERSLRRALHRAGAAIIAGEAGDCVQSVDTLDDYERARSRLDRGDDGE
jgi:molybdopterin-guanine dinucleotide biosynthesis protein A